MLTEVAETIQAQTKDSFAVGSRQVDCRLPTLIAWNEPCVDNPLELGKGLESSDQKTRTI